MCSTGEIQMSVTVLRKCDGNFGNCDKFASCGKALRFNQGKQWYVGHDRKGGNSNGKEHDFSEQLRYLNALILFYMGVIPFYAASCFETLYITLYRNVLRR